MGESYGSPERYSPVERYIPRYAAPSRYLDPYSRRDLYSGGGSVGGGGGGGAVLPPPPPVSVPAASSRYLRPLHRYTPRPARIEYRAHVEYLGSSGGSPLSERCRRLILLEKLRQEYMLREKEELQSDLRYVRTPPLPRTEEPPPAAPGRSPAPHQQQPLPPRLPPQDPPPPLSLCCSGAVGGGGGGGGGGRRTPHHLPTSAVQHHSSSPGVTSSPAPSGIWRSVGPSPPSPSPSPPSQTNSSTPPSMMDSGVYSRSGPSSSETPSSCSSIAPSTAPPMQQPGVCGATAQQQHHQQQQQQQHQQQQTTVGAVRSTSEPNDQHHHSQQHQQHHQHQSTPSKQLRPQLITQRSMPVTEAEHLRAVSTTEILKEKLKKNTALFFGVHEESEKERSVWLDRRKRLASRRCGQLRAEYQAPSLVQTPAVDSVKTTDEIDSRVFHADPCPLRQKPSVASMTFKGVAILAAALNKQRSTDPHGRRRPSSRSYSPSTLGGGSTVPQSPVDDEVFFDRPSLEEPRPPPPTDFVDTTTDLLGPAVERARERQGSWKRSQESRREPSTQVGLSRISGIDLDRAHDNSDRKQYGQGIIHRLFSRSLKRSVITREPVKEQLEDLEDHRPYFTYWLSTVQILILVISLISYGFGPFGMDLSHQSGLVLVTSLSLQQVDYTEPANFWLGPRAADLIHLGAKFAPCMRRDAKIIKEIEKGRERERETACCIRNDDSGCVQLSKADCSVSSRSHIAKGLSPASQISTWKKWSQSDSSSGGRISGSVCGLDPKYCEAPASVAPYEWPDDITKWPICRKNVLNSGVQRVMTKDKLAAEHMVCEVIGHPCCIGIHATCKITTKEYCDFVHGTFHDEASLCSQVSCLDDVCGMFPFLNAEVPDQFYRLISSMFLHAGIIQLAISLWIQWLIMRDLEKLTGTARLMIIYIGSGIAGNLASAIFIPYRADVGPAGSQSGLLACLIVEILNMWPMLKHPYRALFKHLAIAGVLFIIGLLPWFDNFSSFFGFLFGFLLSYAILPFISVGEYDKQKKIFIIWVCLITSAFLFLLLVLFFYVIPVYDCEFCGYFNCLPLTRDFCSAQNINFKRTDGPV